jgi:hypothetical protein
MHVISPVTSAAALHVFLQYNCGEAAAVSGSSTANKNSSQTKIILCSLCAFEKHFNTCKVLGIVTKILLFIMCYLQFYYL